MMTGSLVWHLGKQYRRRSDTAASDQGLHCLLTGNSIKNKIKIENDDAPDTPKFGNGLVQLIGVEKSISHIWVKRASRLTITGDQAVEQANTG